MDRLVRILDDIDDVTGLAFAAGSPAAIAGLACALGLVTGATIYLGLYGTALALVVCGVSMALASVFKRRSVRRR